MHAPWKNDSLPACWLALAGCLALAGSLRPAAAQAPPAAEDAEQTVLLPPRAVITSVRKKEVLAGPGTDQGFAVGMELRVLRGSRPAVKGPEAGKARVVEAAADHMRLELIEGFASAGDFLEGDPIPRPLSALLPAPVRTSPPQFAAPSQTSLEVRLVPLAADAARESVCFGVPFPPGVIDRAEQVTIWQGARQLPAARRELAAWQTPAGRSSVRSVLVELELDFSGGEQTATVRWDRPPGELGEGQEPAATDIAARLFRTRDADSEFEEPRVLALLPPDWLCVSGAAGPQVAFGGNELLPQFDDWQLKLFRPFAVRNKQGKITGRVAAGEKNEPQQAVTLSPDFAHHQLDRTVTLYRLYCRSGEEEVARHAWRHAAFYREHICTADRSSRGRGGFLLKHPDPDAETPDAKYAYVEGLAVHYLLTGDERVLPAVADLMSLWNSPAGGVRDYAEHPGFWTERQAGLAWLAQLHAWQLTGDRAALAAADEICRRVHRMQFAPADGRPPDGCWRHSSGHHGESRKDSWGCSVWMSAILCDAIFQHWLYTADERCPAMLAAFAEYAERHGMTWGGYKPQDMQTPRPWYFSDAAAGGWKFGNESQHNVETGYIFALGHYVRPDPRYLYWAQELLRTDDALMHPRQYVWTYRASPQALWLLAAAGVTPRDMASFGRGGVLLKKP